MQHICVTCRRNQILVKMGAEMKSMQHGQTDLEVTVHNAHIMEVFDSIQNLLNEFTGIFLCVEPLLYDTIKQFPAGHPAERDTCSIILTAIYKISTSL